MITGNDHSELAQAELAQTELAQYLVQGPAGGRVKESLAGDAAVRQAFRNQSEIDALLMLQAGRISIPAGMSSRVHRAIWQRQVRWVTQVAAAAVIVIGLGVFFFVSIRGLDHPDRPAVATHDGGQAPAPAEGAWVETADGPSTMTVPGGARVEISPKTRLKFDALAQGGRIVLEHGQVVCKTEAGGGGATIDSSFGKVTVDARPSTVRVLVHGGGAQPDQTMTVSVVAGQAVLTRTNGVVEHLAAGDVVSVRKPGGANMPGGGTAPTVPPVVPVPPGM
jgi:hypothetical protein